MTKEYNPAFECADLYDSDLESMRASVDFYTAHGTIRERRLARLLGKALLWINREQYFMDTIDDPTENVSLGSLNRRLTQLEKDVHQGIVW